MSDRLKLLIGVPSLGTWVSDFGLSLTFLVAHCLGTPIPGRGNGMEVQVNSTLGSLLPKSRETIIEEALAWKADYLFFADCDQVFPRDTVHKLMNWAKPVVAANIATKELPSQPTARRKSDAIGGDRVFTDDDSTGLEQVWRVGTGVMLINMAIFRGGRVKPPYFEIKYDHEHKLYVGEDWYFCEKLAAAGINVYIDHDLSKVVGHIGTMSFDHSLVGEIVHANFEVQGKASGGEQQGDTRGIPSRRGVPDRVPQGKQGAA